MRTLLWISPLFPLFLFGEAENYRYPLHGSTHTGHSYPLNLVRNLKNLDGLEPVVKQNLRQSPSYRFE